MWYAMREALALVAEEGLGAMWARHEAAHRQLWAGLGCAGLQAALRGACFASPLHPAARPVHVCIGTRSGARSRCRELGLEPFVEDPKDRLATVNTIKAGHYALYCMYAVVWRACGASQHLRAARGPSGRLTAGPRHCRRSRPASTGRR